jgi:diadenosine tetraphosphate (Ap4A) HIT family hydrolase
MRQNLIHESRHFTTRQASDTRVPGHLVVASRGDCTSLDAFTPDQAADLMRCLVRAETLLQHLLQPERIYILKFGEAVPQIHFHVFPRTARLLQAYLGHVADQEPYSGARLMDWVWTHRASTGFAEEEIRSFVDAARAYLGLEGKAS